MEDLFLKDIQHPLDATMFAERRGRMFMVRVDYTPNGAWNYHTIEDAKKIIAWLDAWIKQEEGGGAPVDRVAL